MNNKNCGGVVMSESGFKEYIENRNIEDIMNDYGEQHDEWETMLAVKKDEVVRFLHKNGKTFFCEQYNPNNEKYVVKEEIREVLSGKTIEQQMEHFFITESRRLYSTSYGNISKDDLKENAVKLCDYTGVKNLLVKDKALIGAKIDAYWGDGVLLLDKPVCTYYACDNEGSGTKEREDYAYLIFV